MCCNHRERGPPESPAPIPSSSFGRQIHGRIVVATRHGVDALTVLAFDRVRRTEPDHHDVNADQASAAYKVEQDRDAIDTGDARWMRPTSARVPNDDSVNGSGIVSDAVIVMPSPGSPGIRFHQVILAVIWC